MIKRTFLFFLVLGLTLSSYNYCKEVMSVNDCIEYAIENNPGLRISGLAIDRSIERLNEANASLYPSIGLSGSTRRTSSSISGDDWLFNSYNVGINTRYSLYQGGRIKGQREIAERNIASAEMTYEINTQDMVLRVYQAYYNLLQAKHSLETARKSLKRSKTHLNWARSRYEAGVATFSDVLKVEVEVSDARINILNSENNYSNAAALLNNLMGRPPFSEILIYDDLLEVRFVTLPTFEELQTIAFDNRVELMRLNNLINNQNTAVKISKAEYLPSISFDAGYNYGGRSVSDLNDSWSFGFSFSISVFSGGAIGSRILQDRIALRDYIIQKEELEHNISLALYQSYNDFTSQKDIIENSMMFLSNARENLRIVEGGYKEGVNSIVDLVDAQNSVTIAENRYIRSLAEYRISYANFVRILGQEI